MRSRGRRGGQIRFLKLISKGYNQEYIIKERVNKRPTHCKQSFTWTICEHLRTIVVDNVYCNCYSGLRAKREAKL